MLKWRRWEVLSLFFCLVALVAVHASPTPAGRKITNVASATYEVDGQVYRVESNRVETVVNAIYGITIKDDATKTAPILFGASPGTQVIIPYIVTNTGNTVDSYTLGFELGTPYDLQFGTIGFYLDANGNGVLDTGESQIYSIDDLAPGESVSLLVMLDVRPFAAVGQKLLFDIKGTSTHDPTKTDDDNWRLVTVTGQAVVNATKSSSVSTVGPNGVIQYTINLANIGNQPTVPLMFSTIDMDGDAVVDNTSGLFVEDAIPTGLAVTGDASVDFPPTQRNDVVCLYGYTNGYWSIDGNAHAWGGTAAVDAVGWLLVGSLLQGQSVELQWNAKALPVPPADKISNVATVTWGISDGIDTVEETKDTNTVIVQVGPTPGVTIGPKGDPFGMGSGTYKTPDPTLGPYVMSYSANVSTADFVSVSSASTTKVVFFHTLKNTGTYEDSYDLLYDWIENPIPGISVKFLMADGVTPLYPRSVSSKSNLLLSRAAQTTATVGPLAPGATLDVIAEITIPLGTTADELEHKLAIGATSKTSGTVTATTTDIMKFATSMWQPFLKTAIPSNDVEPGKSIHYTIFFGNAGTVDAVNSTLFDVLPLVLGTPSNITDGNVTGSINGTATTIPVHVEFAPDDPAGTRGRISWIFPNIPAGFTGSVSYDAVVDANAADGTEIHNVASITAQGMTTSISNTTNNMVMRPNRLMVQKSADKAAAATGSTVRYTVKAKNVSTTAKISSPVAIYDTLPKGFNFVSGSATLNGAPLADPVVTPGTRTLTWADIGPLNPQEEKSVSYSVLVGPLAKSGENYNKALASGILASGTQTTSNTAAARVVVYESLAVDSQTIIGRVYFDLNGNKVADSGEPGLPGVRLYLENGTYTVTDSQGKYHFEDIKSGTHIIKLDKGSLPKNITLMDPSRVGALGDIDSVMIELKKGELAKVNFRVFDAKPKANATDLSGVAKTLPDSTLALSDQACAGVSYTVSPSKSVIDENLISVSVDKAAAGPLSYSYLVVKPSFEPGSASAMLEADPVARIDPNSVFVDDKPPAAVFSFGGALWIRLPDTRAFDGKQFDQNGPTVKPEAFAQGQVYKIHYVAKNDVKLRHYVLGIDTQNAIAVVSEDNGAQKGATALSISDSALLDERNSLVSDYQAIQPEAGKAKYDALGVGQTSKTFGIIGPAAGETYWIRDKISVIVRFPMGGSAGPVGLRVNGQPVAESSIGTKMYDSDGTMGRYDYIGVPIAPGKNILEFTYTDATGTSQTDSIVVYHSGAITSVKVETNPKVLFADGKTEPEIIVKPLDAEGIPMPEGSFVTLSLDAGRFVSQDANPQRDGFQARIENGVAKVKITAEFAAVDRKLTVLAGNYSQDVKLEFMPFLRDWIINGFGEGSLNYAFNTPNQYGDVEGPPDGFSVDGKVSAFVKGTIFGCYLLTAAYDSKPPVKEDDKLYQELQPDKLFPTYGDASVQQYDAETSDGKFVKIEKDKSYALYGDYDTGFSDTDLTRYNRSFTGAKLSLDSKVADVKGFWARTNQSLVKDEIRGNGTSGYYQLSRSSIVENTDKISIEVRSANDPSVVLQRTNLTRYTDYWLNPLDGSILFNEPVQSADAVGNPTFIVVVYEVEESSDLYDVLGVRPKVSLFGDALELGGTGVFELGEAYTNKLYGADATLRLGKHFTAQAEAAWSDVLDGATATTLQGAAQSASITADYGDALTAVGRYLSTDENFRNPSLSSFQGAMREWSLLAKHTPVQGVGIFFDGTDKENLKTGDTLLSAGLQSRIPLSQRLRTLLGVRYVDLEQDALTQKAVLGKAGLSYDLTSRLETTFFVEQAVWGDHLPGTQYSSAQNLFDRFTSTSSNASLVGAGYMDTGADTTLAGYPDRIFWGFNYKLTSGTNIGLGHEWLGDPGSMVGRTVLGVSSELTKNTYAYANYGIEDSIDEPRNLANFGVKSKFDLTQRLAMNVGLESLWAIQGTTGDENFVAPTVDLTYLSDLEKYTVGLQYRYGAVDQRILTQVGATRKVTASVSFSAKDIFALTLPKTGGSEYRHTFNVGLAYRPLFTDTWNVLSKLTFDDNKTVVGVRDLKLVGSVEANWQPMRELTLSGKYTAKYLYDLADNVGTGSFLDLYALRAMYDITDRVDVGVHFGLMPNWASSTLDYYAGIQAGYRIVKNLYVSGGWNFQGLNDADLVENSYRSMGFFLGLRFKFDEGTFGLDR